jgi:exopolysaccharide production protein ExoY
MSVRMSNRLAFLSADELPGAVRRPVGFFTKRLVDIGLASSAIISLAPLLLLCSIGVALSTRSSPLFRHPRVGFQGRTFQCLKFRTMLPDADHRLHNYFESFPDAKAEWDLKQKLQFDPRVTRFGAILRKTSLDELPQLFNVLRGDMSVVGPRPVTKLELPRYAGNVIHYFACRPGITGLWQVNGRSGTSFARRVGYDRFYSLHWSLALDAKIILVTLPVVFSSKNAY